MIIGGSEGVERRVLNLMDVHLPLCVCWMGMFKDGNYSVVVLTMNHKISALCFTWRTVAFGCNYSADGIRNWVGRVKNLALPCAIAMI